MKNTELQKRRSSENSCHSLHRFFVSAADINNNQIVLDARQTHQIRDVLRLAPGRRIIVLDNQGAEFEVILKTLGTDQATARVLEKRRAPNEPRTRITLFQSLTRQDKFEYVLQKCTELGVNTFVPMIANRSVIRHCDDIKPNKITRWQRIITEAAEQSHRGRIPNLKLPVTFEKGMAELKAHDRTLIASTRAHSGSLRNCLKDRSEAERAAVALLVGPEGGFTEDEVARATAGGAIPFNLGPRVLRTETAAVVAASLIMYELGEMDP